MRKHSWATTTAAAAAATTTTLLYCLLIPPWQQRMAEGFQPPFLQQQQQQRSTRRFLPNRIEGQYLYTYSSSSSSSYNNNNHNHKNKNLALSSHHQQQQQQQDTSSSRSSSTSTTTTSQQQKHSSSSSSTSNNNKKKKKFKHAMAILAMPYCSLDRIANEVILNTVLPRTDKLSVVLRCESLPNSNIQAPSLPRLRRYVGEVYSQLWDCVMYETVSSSSSSTDNADTTTTTTTTTTTATPPLPPVFALPDICVYPANLPNAAPESWIDIQPDLQAVCSHDSMIGWISEGATGTGVSYQCSEFGGVGGLAAHVRALNAERTQRGLAPVQALPVPESQWPIPTTTTSSASASSSPSSPLLAGETVIFVDDDPEDQCQSPLWQAFQEQTAMAAAAAATAANKNNNKKNQREQQQQQQQPNYSPNSDDDDACLIPSLLGGANIPNKALFESVCCGGTFDGMHFGHRKLLTLAVSSVNPMTGRLLIGVTVDRMLTKKQYVDYMPTYQERVQGVRNFLHRLAPGMMNRVQIVPIEDAFGPPGQAGPMSAQFDALVLSHETLETGHQLNRHRVEVLNLKPLTLLCTRRTEAHGMSSTTLRKLRADQVQQQQQQQQQEKQQ